MGLRAKGRCFGLVWVVHFSEEPVKQGGGGGVWVVQALWGLGASGLQFKAARSFGLRSSGCSGFRSWSSKGFLRRCVS